MNENTITAIETMAKADPGCTPAVLLAIKKACEQQRPSPGKLVNAREAMKILGVSRPTLRKLTRTGKIQEIRPTPRKTRFYLDEVEKLAYLPVKNRESER